MVTLRVQEIKNVLTNYIGKHILQRNDVQLVDFFQPSGGWSDEVYVITLGWEEQGRYKEQGFVIRKAKEVGLTFGEKNLYPQFTILDTLSKHTKLPIPKVYIFERDKSILGNEFFIMEKVEGKSYVPWSKEGRRFFANATKGPIPEQFVKYLADLHCLDYKKLALNQSILKRNSANYIDEKIKELEDIYERYTFFDDPVVTDAMEWLKGNKPNPISPCLIHNDYRTGNLLYKEEEITGILDWESAEIGDPR